MSKAPSYYAQGSLGKGRLAIPQEVGSSPEMVMTARHTGADPQPVPPWEWRRRAVAEGEKAKWTAAGKGEEVEFLYCVGVRPDGVAGWRPLHFSAHRGH